MGVRKSWRSRRNSPGDDRVRSMILLSSLYSHVPMMTGLEAHVHTVVTGSGGADAMLKSEGEGHPSGGFTDDHHVQSCSERGGASISGRGGGFAISRAGRAPCAGSGCAFAGRAYAPSGSQSAVR